MKLLLFILLIASAAHGQINASKFKSSGSTSMLFYTPTRTFDTIKIAQNPPLLANYTEKDNVLTLYVSKDSLIKYLCKYLDYSAIVKRIVDSSGTGEPANYTELKTLREENKRLTTLIDSLQSKINKQLEYHYYSCEIISTLKPNGTLANRRQYHKAITAYFERYGKVKRKFENDKKILLYNEKNKPL